MYHITVSLRLVKKLTSTLPGIPEGSKKYTEEKCIYCSTIFFITIFIYFFLHSLVELTKRDALYHSCILLTKGHVINRKVELFRSQLSILTTQNSYFSGISTKPTENYGVIREHCLRLVRTSQQLHC